MEEATEAEVDFTAVEAGFMAVEGFAADEDSAVGIALEADGDSAEVFAEAEVLAAGAELGVRMAAGCIAAAGLDLGEDIQPADTMDMMDMDERDLAAGRSMAGLRPDLGGAMVPAAVLAVPAALPTLARPLQMGIPLAGVEPAPLGRAGRAEFTVRLRTEDGISSVEAECVPPGAGWEDFLMALRTEVGIRLAEGG